MAGQRRARSRCTPGGRGRRVDDLVVRRRAARRDRLARAPSTGSSSVLGGHDALGQLDELVAASRRARPRCRHAERHRAGTQLRRAHATVRAARTVFTTRSRAVVRVGHKSACNRRSILQRHEDQPRGPALPLDGVAGVQARRPARARPARVRHAAGGGLRPRQAPRDGLRDDHRPRHDRRRPGDRRPARRLRLRGADRAVPRRAAGRPHPLLRDHAGRPRVAAGARRRRRGRRRRTCTSSEITCALAHPFYAVEAPLLPRHRRRLAQLFDDLGGPQRLARARAQPPGGDLRRDARRHRRRRLRRPRGRRHRPHLVGDARAPRRRREFLAHVRAGRVERARRAGLGRQVGARRDGAGDPRARPRRRRRRARPGGRAADGRARDDARATPAPARSAATSAPRTPARCCAPGSTRSTCA